VVKVFSKGFHDIIEEMCYLSTSKEVLDAQPIRQGIANAYVQLSKFLYYSMNWYGKRIKRFTVSLRGNFYDDNIKAYVDEVGT
jgi:hypothetical protein